MARRRAQCIRAGGRGGVTLVELMVSTSVLSIILGAVLLLQLQGLKAYQDVAATNRASFQAAAAVELMEEEIEACYRVVGRAPDRIVVSMPRTAWNVDQQANLPAQPLQFGSTVRYYLADSAGTYGTTGTYLWRAEKPVGATSYTLGRQPLARNVTSLQFAYTMAAAPRAASVATVGLTVVARVKQGGVTRPCTHTAQIVLRNVGYGPVTAETGRDT